MTEQQGFNTVYTLLIIISVYCFCMLIISSADGYKDINSIYVTINLCVYWKFYFGIKRYENLAERNILNRSGLKVLEHTLIRFY